VAEEWAGVEATHRGRQSTPLPRAARWRSGSAVSAAGAESRRRRGGLTAARGPASSERLTGVQLLCRWRARGTDARGTDARGTDARGTDPRGTDARGTKARAHTTPRDGPVGGRQRARAQSGPIRCIVRIGNTTRTDRAVVLATKRAGRPGGRPGDDSDRTYRDDSDRTYRDDSAAKADVSGGCGRAGPRHQSAGTACSGAGAGLPQEAGAHNGAVGASAAAGRLPPGRSREPPGRSREAREGPPARRDDGGPGRLGRGGSGKPSEERPARKIGVETVMDSGLVTAPADPR